MNSLIAVTPIDGRYYTKTKHLSPYFSEYALFKYRVRVEIEYFLALLDQKLPQIDGFPLDKVDELRKIYTEFSENDAQEIKDIEKVTNHDVKAVEYFIKKKFDALGLEKYKEFIHFGLTSQDINNTAIPLSLLEYWNEEYLPNIKTLTDDIIKMSKAYGNIPMLARTHGQPASPTTLGKEMFVFAERLQNQLVLAENIPFCAKFGGATGNFNAHKVAYPEINWPAFGDHFVARHLGLTRLKTTTQIEHYDHMAALFDSVARINTILIDFSRDIWTYVSMDYFKQKIKEGEVGSSAMPHKVNPIDFENAEGNLGLANAMLNHLSAKLPISRLQRDLTDSTVTRNIGVPFAYSEIAISSLIKGINKLKVNEAVIKNELENNWIIVAEAIQTVLRREAFPNPYEELKALTRTNSSIGKEDIHSFIESLSIPDKLKHELKQITPSNYIGFA